MPDIKHGVPNQYGWIVLFPENFVLGKYTDLAYGVFINAKYGVTVEEDVQIGPYVCILSDNTINNTSGRIFIGKGAMIGAYTLILPGVTIEPGQYIKARSNLK